MANPHPAAADLERLRTTAQVAAETGYSLRTVHRWIDEGLLQPTFQLPGEKGAFLFDVAHVAAVAPRKRTRKPKPKAAA